MMGGLAGREEAVATRRQNRRRAVGFSNIDQIVEFLQGGPGGRLDPAQPRIFRVARQQGAFEAGQHRFQALDNGGGFRNVRSL
jgi:hypothetical protein